MSYCYSRLYDRSQVNVRKDENKQNGNSLDLNKSLFIIGGVEEGIGHKSGIRSTQADWTATPVVHYGGPFGTVPELLFEKKRLIPAVQQLLACSSDL